MPDARRHRGPHPEDAWLLAPAQRPALVEATRHLAWLLSRGYAEPSALKLVGDRFQLAARQRLAVRRCCCSDQAWAARRARELGPADLAGRPLAIDAFNLLLTVESALAGGTVLVGREGCCRDLASMHGSYRRVEETRPALERIGRTLQPLVTGPCTWWIDRPVSNSGRLAEMIRGIARRLGWDWHTELVADADTVLVASPEAVVVTADGPVLDRCGPWFNLAAAVIRDLPDARVLVLGEAPDDSSCATSAHRLPGLESRARSSDDEQ